MVKYQHNRQHVPRLGTTEGEERSSNKDKDLPHDQTEQGNIYPKYDKASPVPSCLYDPQMTLNAPCAPPSYIQEYSHKCMIPCARSPTVPTFPLPLPPSVLCVSILTLYVSNLPLCEQSLSLSLSLSVYEQSPSVWAITLRVSNLALLLSVWVSLSAAPLSPFLSPSHPLYLPPLSLSRSTSLSCSPSVPHPHTTALYQYPTPPPPPVRHTHSRSPHPNVSLTFSLSLWGTPSLSISPLFLAPVLPMQLNWSTQKTPQSTVGRPRGLKTVPHECRKKKDTFLPRHRPCRCSEALARVRVPMQMSSPGSPTCQTACELYINYF